MTDESVSSESTDELVADLLEVSSSDLSVAAEIVRLGTNRYYKRLDGGADEASKLAAQMIKLGFSGGKSKAELAEAIRSGGISVGA